MEKVFETTNARQISMDGEPYYAIPVIEEKEKIVFTQEKKIAFNAGGGYQIHVKCMNCQKKQTIIIPEGNLFEPFPVVKQSRINKKGLFSKAKTINCHYCGCATLARGGETNEEM